MVKVLRLDAFLKTSEGFLVSSSQFVVADPLEHQLVREDAIVINLKSILIEC